MEPLNDDDDDEDEDTHGGASWSGGALISILSIGPLEDRQCQYLKTRPRPESML